MTQYDSPFAYMGLRLWNMVPRYKNLMIKVEKFKRRLMTGLLSLPDKLPVHGYVRANNNSLVEVAALSRN